MGDRPRPLLMPRPDLGLRALLPAWREASRRATRWSDVIAGAAALGPSFALALLAAHHAGLPPAAALTCAVVGSAVVALFGGTTLGLAGPGLAMGFALADVARDYGAAPLALAGAMCGLSQLVVGVLGVGRFARLVPLSVVHGFVLGLGALLVIRSLPDVLGLAAPADLDPLGALDHIGAHLGGARAPALAMAMLAGAATWLGARYARRAPVALLAIAACAWVTRRAHLDLPTLSDMPFALPLGPWPGEPAHGVAQFGRAALVLFALASMETLLSASAEEERVPGARPDLDQEMIGYGLANIVLSLLGSVPAAGSIARSSVLRAAGGVHRAAALFHALFGAALVAVVLLVDRSVPLAALAGVVIAIAAPLLDFRPLVAVYRVSRSGAVVLVATALVMIFGGLLRGIEAGLLATLALALWRIARFRAAVHQGSAGAPHQVNFSGPITFLVVLELEKTRRRLAALDPTADVILDIRGVLVMDLTGCERFLALVTELFDRGVRVVVLGASPACRDKLLAADRRKILDGRLAITDRDVDAILGRARAFEMRAQVVANLERFRIEVREHYTPLFDQLADGQHPHTLFVTCVDSRITPSMLTGTHPGDLFIVRALGAMVPPPGESTRPGEGAAVEYAVGVLGVRNIVICGHSSCGAVKAAKSGEVPDELPTLRRWLAEIPEASGDLSGYADVDEAARAVIVRQLDNLRRFPLVRDRLASGEIELHGWFYDVRQAELFEWDEAKGAFTVMEGRGANEVRSEPPPLR
ncbi:bifunctional SulP family inorganic anion transporter/carbonic anhydrase [Sorangium sp. So ce426]|uniref:bifunctional SulP family inorganic anion transporter/carbonic anhydrase n=1 Tax=Sorangium sp. So ce426 TaxID=3133312 RepID=UPI003F5B2C4D